MAGRAEVVHMVVQGEEEVMVAAAEQVAVGAGEGDVEAVAAAEVETGISLVPSSDRLGN